MKTIITNIAVILMLALITACGALKTSNEFMAINDPKAKYTPKIGKALIIFERENTRSGESNTVSLWDATSRQEPELIGLIQPTMKVAYQVQPGEHYFLSVFSGNRQLVKATMEADRTYYVFLKMDHRIKFQPIKKGQENPMTAIGISEMKSAGTNWAPENIKIATAHVQKAFTTWNTMSDIEKAKFTIIPEDGK